MSIQRNRGVQIATGDVVVFLDDDVAVEPGFFAALAAAYRGGRLDLAPYYLVVATR